MQVKWEYTSKPVNLEEQRERGVVAASSGNHALGLSYHGKQLSVPVTVCIPETASIVKIEKCKKLGANVIVSGRSFDEAKSFAVSYAQEKHLTYVNSFDDPLIIAGQGTILLEIAQQIQHLDAVIVPVGGGGLISGITIAAKTLFPNCQIIGVEPKFCDSMNQSLTAKRLVTLDMDTTFTIADGLNVKTVGGTTLKILLQSHIQMIQVDECNLFNAVVKLIECERCVVEGAGAAGIAALVAGQLDHLQNKKVAFILCGSNIDSLTLANVIDRALFSSGRLVRISVAVNDRPGGLSHLFNMLKHYQINVRDVSTERVSVETSVYLCKVDMFLEFQTSTQSNEFRIALSDYYGSKLKWNPQ